MIKINGVEFREQIKKDFCFYANLSFDEGNEYMPLILMGADFIKHKVKSEKIFEKNKEFLSRLAASYTYYKFCLIRYQVKTSLGHIKIDSDKERLESAKKIFEIEMMLGSNFLKDEDFVFSVI